MQRDVAGGRLGGKCVAILQIRLIFATDHHDSKDFYEDTGGITEEEIKTKTENAGYLVKCRCYLCGEEIEVESFE